MKNLAIITMIALTLATVPMVKVHGMLKKLRQPETTNMTRDDIRDRCCWKNCRASSDMIFMGAGLCDEHWTLAGSTYKSAYEYAVDRVVPEAAEAMRSQQEINESKNQ